MSTVFASKTTVSVSRSQEEIRKILSKYGATSFAFAESAGKALIMFELQGRRIMFKLPLPMPPEQKWKLATIKTYEQTLRSKWRSLCLGIKAKLECVAAGITTLEEEFLAHIVLPNGATVGQVMKPQLEDAYKNGKMPPMLGMR